MRTNKRALGRELEQLLLTEHNQNFPEDEVFVAVHVLSKTLLVVETLFQLPGGGRSVFSRVEYRDPNSKDWVAREIIKSVRERLEAKKGGAA